MRPATKQYQPLVFLASMIAFASAYAAASADESDDFFRLTKDYFARESMVPITVPSGQEPGDIFDARNNSLLARRSDCFPKLPKPAATSSSLPHIESKSSLNIGLSLSAPVIVEAQGRNISAKLARIDFDSATASSISVIAFRKAADYANCPFLKLPLQGVANTRENAPEVPVIISEVISAKRDVQLSFDDHATASLALAKLKELISKQGATASVDFDNQDNRKVWVRADEALPIAYRPVYTAEIAKKVEAPNQAPSSREMIRALIDRTLGAAPASMQ